MMKIEVTTGKIDSSPTRTEEERWEAVQRRDQGADGAFVFAVRSTGIYCRPSCPARRPRRDRVVFFRSCEVAELAGFRPCKRCRPRERSAHADVVSQVCRFIENHPDAPVRLTALAERAGMSSFHLQRIFKRSLGVSPKEYADGCRFRTFKNKLKQAGSITEAVYAAGYGSSSRAYERTNARLGMTPSRYRQGGIQTRIGYTITNCPLGRLLVAATDKGICAVSLGDRDPVLESSLRREFPAAEIRRGGAKLSAFARVIVRHLQDDQPRLDLPLDVRATAFQERVWTALRSIPYGQTQSYREIARAIHRPNATRAVARACATNPVALVIPCHRVVRGDGQLAGYRWGLKRKAALLELETRKKNGA